jgi:hypothetical protein
LEEEVLARLSDVALHLPMDSRQLLQTVNKNLPSAAQHNQVTNLLQKFAVQLLIRYQQINIHPPVQFTKTFSFCLLVGLSIQEKVCDEGTFIEIISADHTKLSAMITAGDRTFPSSPRKRKGM